MSDNLFQSFLRKLLGIQSPEAPSPTDPDEPPLEEQIAEQAEAHVRAGYLDEAEIVEALTDVFEDEPGAVDVRALSQRAARTAIRNLQSEAAHWPPITDYDRLEEALQQLEDAGIVARQNFSCCGTCGSAEIGAEIEDFEEQGRDARGYLFFHEQDTESAVGGYGLYLNYGATAEGEEAALAIGREIVARLEACGLSTQWDGTWARRISVSLEWQRRWRCA